ncbi:copper homeostasis protein CutC [Kaistia algarum]|uniref:copper homeostasis protein CutC n=1 Tax=Kaistia algarum TaxID=2083279 RepID=UPI003898E3DC
MGVTVEICVESAEGLAAAMAGGADRIELCAALSLGGLTPSPGLMRIAAKAAIPVYAMIRPREGDFVYSPADFDQMRREIDAVRSAGLAGIAIGACEQGGRLDAEALFHLMAHAKGLGATLHRAFDAAPDPFEAIDIAVGLGFERVLSSGGPGTAEDNRMRVAEFVRHAGARISVMPGSGVRSRNVTRILAATGAYEVHASCRTGSRIEAPEAVRLGFASGPTAPATSETEVADLVAAIRTFENTPA